MNIQTAYETANRQLIREPSASAVTIEFVNMLGLTKYLRVWRSDQVEVLNTIEEAEAA